jgi:uncharacterized Tic20 family protein
MTDQHEPEKPTSPDPAGAREVEAERFDAKTSEGRTYDMPAGAAPKADQANLSLAALCHLLGLLDATVSFMFAGLIAPLVLWLVLRDTDPEVDFAGRESVNFQINLLVWQAVSVMLFLCGIGFVMFGALMIAEIVLVIVATVQTLRGERFRYPLIFRFVR